jgi:hypothetical protein
MILHFLYKFIHILHNIQSNSLFATFVVVNEMIGVAVTL